MATRRPRRRSPRFLRLAAALFTLSRLATDGGAGGAEASDATPPSGNPAGGNPEGKPSSGKPADSKPAEPVVPQSVVNDVVAREKAEAAKAVEAQWREAVGDLTPQQVAEFMAERQAAIEAEKTEIEKALDRASAAEAAQAQAEAAALKARLERSLILELSRPVTDDEGNITAGAVAPEHLDTVLELALPRALAAEGDDRVAQAVADVRAKAAPFFVTPNANPDPANGNGSTPDRKPAPTPDRKLGENTAPRDGDTPNSVANFRALREAGELL